LTESVAALVSEGFVELAEIAVGGTKISSPAASRSFTRGGRLERIERQATERVERLKHEVAFDPAAASRRPAGGATTRGAGGRGEGGPN
jgi:hypothetical protein